MLGHMHVACISPADIVHRLVQATGQEAHIARLTLFLTGAIRHIFVAFELLLEGEFCGWEVSQVSGYPIPSVQVSFFRNQFDPSVKGCCAPCSGLRRGIRWNICLFRGERRSDSSTLYPNQPQQRNSLVVESDHIQFLL